MMVISNWFFTLESLIRAFHFSLMCWTSCLNKFHFPTVVTNFLVVSTACLLRFVLDLLGSMLKMMRLWSSCVSSSLTPQSCTLYAAFIEVTVMSIQLTPFGTKYVDQSFSFRRPWDDKNSTIVVPLVSLIGLCHVLCFLLTSRPQIRLFGFSTFRNVSIWERSSSML